MMMMMGERCRIFFTLYIICMWFWGAIFNITETLIAYVIRDFYLL